jgi:hypothetical protein
LDLGVDGYQLRGKGGLLANQGGRRD